MITLKPLMHRGILCVGIFWGKNRRVTSVVRSFDGRRFSITHCCWYIRFSESGLKQLIDRLTEIGLVFFKRECRQNYEIQFSNFLQYINPKTVRYFDEEDIHQYLLLSSYPMFPSPRKIRS